MKTKEEMYAFLKETYHNKESVSEKGLKLWEDNRFNWLSLKLMFFDFLGVERLTQEQVDVFYDFRENNESEYQKAHFESLKAKYRFIGKDCD